MCNTQDTVERITTRRKQLPLFLSRVVCGLYGTVNTGKSNVDRPNVPVTHNEWVEYLTSVKKLVTSIHDSGGAPFYTNSVGLHWIYLRHDAPKSVLKELKGLGFDLLPKSLRKHYKNVE